MEIHDDALRGMGYSEIKESSGLAKEELEKHKMFTIFGTYFKYIVSNFSSNHEHLMFILFNYMFYLIFNMFGCIP